MIAEAPEIKLTLFEGPLDLLLYLIRRQEIDIHDIPISQITQQYLTALDEMSHMSLEVAGEFIMMVTYLLYIKAQMLLPRTEVESGEEDDPRRPLVEKLLEYQKFKQIGEELKRIENERSGFYPREFDPSIVGAADNLSIDFNVYDLYRAYIDIVKGSSEFARASITGDLIDIEERINYILSKFNGVSKRSFLDLTEGLNRLYLVATFIAMLELVRQGKLIVKQVKLFGNIFIHRKDN